MKTPDYNSPLALKVFLDENGMAMQKKFGQNFLVNEAARKKIIDAHERLKGRTSLLLGQSRARWEDSAFPQCTFLCNQVSAVVALSVYLRS